jgi:hypothetical protein
VAAVRAFCALNILLSTQNYAAQLAEVQRKRLEDEVWGNQEREVESAFTIANNALTQAGIAMSSNADLSALLVWLILPVFKVSAACVGYRYAVGRLYA